MAKKNKFNLAKILRDHGSSQKQFAEWLGMTPEGLSMASKNGLSKAYLEALKNYCSELRGVCLAIDFNFFSND